MVINLSNLLLSFIILLKTFSYTGLEVCETSVTSQKLAINMIIIFVLPNLFQIDFIWSFVNIVLSKVKRTANR